uniref:Uncharacterized protein n=1 Tax=Arundo donax TaxID=35708 RepID=A0A0A9GJ32_ARUDO
MGIGPWHSDLTNPGTSISHLPSTSLPRPPTSPTQAPAPPHPGRYCRGT